MTDALVNTNRVRINTLALGARLPTMLGEKGYVESGGLMSYGPNFPDLYRRAADYVDKILRGAKPADIPVEQPTKFELVINLKTAKALGLTMPPIAARPRRRGDRMMMRRREFITRLGGAAMAWPLAARAQQSKQIRRIGVLMNIAADSPEAPGRVGALAQGLAEQGWTIGGNVQVDYRWYASDADASRKYAEELIALAPDVFLAIGTLAATALQRAAGPAPIVFALVSDPVGAGLVDSLARPGGNLTGFMNYEYGFSAKWLDLLKQIAPDIKRAAVLRDRSNPAGTAQFGILKPQHHQLE